MKDVIIDALLDTLKLLPFLLLLYILIELMEHNTGVGKPRKSLTGKFAPVLGAGLGLVPMCGFSVMAAKLYQHRHVTFGTLCAVFITTSDEALLVLLLSGMGWAHKLITVGVLCACKFVLGIAVGYLLDFVRGRSALAPLPENEHAHGHDHHEEREVHHVCEEHDHEEQGEEVHEHGDCACDELSPCEHKHEGKLTMYLFSPLLHALEVAGFVLIVNLLFGFLIFGLGEENVIGFLQGSAFWAQPAVCALIGLIPNCASSVVLAEAFAIGGIGFGGLFAGLVVNAGLGYLILLKKNNWRRGLLLLGGMLLLGIAAGYVASAVCLAI